MKSIKERIKDAEDSLPVPYYKLRELEAQNAELLAENERLRAKSESEKNELIEKQKYILSLERMVTGLQARVAELEAASISRSLILKRLQELPDIQRMNEYATEIIWGIMGEIDDGNFNINETSDEK